MRARMTLGVVALLIGADGACDLRAQDPPPPPPLPPRESADITARLDTIRMARGAARSRSAAGDHRAAAMEYGRVIATIGFLPGSFQEESVLADAYFGRASAWLQLRRAAVPGDTAGVAADAGWVEVHCAVEAARKCGR